MAQGPEKMGSKKVAVLESKSCFSTHGPFVCENQDMIGQPETGTARPQGGLTHIIDTLVGWYSLEEESRSAPGTLKVQYLCSSRLDWLRMGTGNKKCGQEHYYIGSVDGQVRGE